MIRILQINMHRSATAHQLLAQFAAEVNVDLMLIGEQYRNNEPTSWYLDLSGTFFSVYLTPNETLPNFRRWLDAQEDAFSSTEAVISMPGPLNGACLSQIKRTLEMATKTALVVLNTRSTRTFRRPGCEGSIPGITFASKPLASSKDGWRVLEVIGK